MVLQAVLNGRRFDVTNLTPSEARLRVNGQGPIETPAKAEIILERQGTRVTRGLAVDLREGGDDARTVVARFGNLSLGDARTLLGLRRNVASRDAEPFVRELIDEPERIAMALQALYWSEAKGFLVDARNRSVRVRLQHFEGTSSTAVWAVDDHLSLEAPFEISLQGPWSVFSFTVDKVGTCAGLLATSLPTRVTRTRRRVWRRIVGAFAADLRFAHPLWPELEVRARVADTSFGGIALHADAEEMLLFPGLELPEVALEHGPAAGVVVPAQVRHVSGSGEDRHAVCGLHVRSNASANDAWTAALRDVFYPRTMSGATPFKALWSLYGDSGYLGVAGKQGSSDTDLASNAENAARTLDAAPEIGINVVWPSRKDVTGALALVKIYQHTWFGQHMAKRQGPTADGWPGRLVLREMHLHAYEHALRDSDTRWLLGYVRHDAGWPRSVHVAFPERMRRTGETCVVPFRAIRIPCTAHSEGVADVLAPDVDVREAADGELGEIAAAIARLRPSPYVECLDLVEERLRMSVVRNRWERAGLRRERLVLVARRSQRIVAAGVFETTTDGVHVFGLLDCARLFSLGEGGADTFAGLLAAARSWFRAHGRRAFVYLAESELPAGLARLDAVDMGGADATVTPVALLPDMLEHLWQITKSAPVPTM